MEPSPEVEDPDEFEVPADVPLVEPDFAAAVRSPNRFCVPRSAPRLDFGPVELVDDEDDDPDAAPDEDDGALDDEEEEVEEVEEDEVDEEPEDDELPPAAFLGPVELRFPESCGVRMVRNLSAATTPLTRMVRSKFCDSTVKDGTAEVSCAWSACGLASFAYRTAPAASSTTTASKTTPFTGIVPSRFVPFMRLSTSDVKIDT